MCVRKNPIINCEPQMFNRAADSGNIVTNITHLHRQLCYDFSYYLQLVKAVCTVILCTTHNVFNSNVKMYSTCVVLKTQEHSLCIIFTLVNINHLYFLWKCVRLLWQSVLPASGASHVASCCHGYSQCSFTVVYWSAWTNEPWAMARYEIISFSLTLEKCWVSARSEMFVKLRRYGFRVEGEVWLHLLFFFVPSWLDLTENIAVQHWGRQDYRKGNTHQ